MAARGKSAPLTFLGTFRDHFTEQGGKVKLHFGALFSLPSVFLGCVLDPRAFAQSFVYTKVPQCFKGLSAQWFPSCCFSCSLGFSLLWTVHPKGSVF